MGRIRSSGAAARIYAARRLVVYLIVPVSPRRCDASVAVRDHGHVLQLLDLVRFEGQLLVLVVVGVAEGVVGRDIEEVGFLGRDGW